MCLPNGDRRRARYARRDGGVALGERSPSGYEFEPRFGSRQYVGERFPGIDTHRSVAQTGAWRERSLA
ncbi:hypothetical protein Asi02nite_75450 [Asanoa siamensis]|uniref:Uncharacterized protein n=1 Tax=Asanoa siamensis TaxID=926357 RepID=A0ABQ4D3B2_9ACTN|nr:hypothetical protein Asi02nite_75450 [Asanoa siamensis]